MKLTLMSLIATFMAFVPFAHAMDKHSMGNKAPVTAVVFYADNCGSCKILDPRMKEALTIINEDKVDVVKFDFSNKEAIEATRKLASKKGLDATLQKYGARTGFVILVDHNSEEVDRLKVDHDTGDIASKMAKAIAKAS